MARKKRPGKSEPGRGSEQDRSELGSDYLLDAAEANGPYILRWYRLFEEKKPVMQYDVQEKRVSA